MSPPIAPAIMMIIGEMPNNHTSNADKAGIHTAVFFIFIVFHITNTGAAIIAITTGLMPLNILSTTGF